MIRKATLSDVPAIVVLGRAMALESPRWRSMAYKTEKVELLTKRLVAFGGVFVSEVHVGSRAGLVGMIAGTVTEHWFSDVQHLATLVLYVVPSHRSTGMASELIRALEVWGREAGAAESIMGAHMGNDARTFQLYERMGYSETGRNFRRALTSTE